MDGPPRILVVDDEPKILRLLESLLGREGYRVETAPDAAAALRGVVRTHPDLLVTDLMMPGMDGLELARRAREIDADLPIVLITGYASMETAVAALREGVSDYVTKPFSLAELKAVVGRILSHRELAAENRRLVRELRVANAELEQHRNRLTAKVREAEDGLVAANEALTRRLGEMEVIHEISQMVATVFDASELLSLATQLVRDKVGLDAIAMLLLEPDGGGLVAHGVRGLAPGLADGDRLPAGEGIAGAVLAGAAPILLPDAGGDPRPSPAERRAFGEGALLALPVRAKDRVAGVLLASRTRGNGALSDDDARLLGLIANDLSVAVENARLFLENERNYIEILAVLVQSMEARDPYLRRHSDRVATMSGILGDALGLSDADRDVLVTGARLHDLGKVGIPDRILHKPGPLTEDEMAIMRSHPVIGDRIVRPLGKLSAVKPIIRNHHERWDGTGYPDGLVGEAIPLLTRIVSVADAYDALTSDRSYRPAMTREDAREIVRRTAGTHFGPYVAEVFLDCVPEPRELDAVGWRSS